jgi:hypothetical protein
MDRKEDFEPVSRAAVPPATYSLPLICSYLCSTPLSRGSHSFLSPRTARETPWMLSSLGARRRETSTWECHVPDASCFPRQNSHLPNMFAWLGIHRIFYSSLKCSYSALEHILPSDSNYIVLPDLPSHYLDRFLITMHQLAFLPSAQTYPVITCYFLWLDNPQGD